MSEDVEKLRKQVADQCAAVAHMARALAEVHSLAAKYGCADEILERVGNRTAGLMETLGDILNSIDATDDEDAWLDPIFEEAQRRWPQKADA